MIDTNLCICNTETVLSLRLSIHELYVTTDGIQVKQNTVDHYDFVMQWSTCYHEYTHFHVTGSQF